MSLWLSHRCAGPHSWHLHAKAHVISQQEGKREYHELCSIHRYCMYTSNSINIFYCNFAFAAVGYAWVIAPLSTVIVKQRPKKCLKSQIKCIHQCHFSVMDVRWKKSSLNSFLWQCDTRWWRIVSFFAAPHKIICWFMLYKYTLFLVWLQQRTLLALMKMFFFFKVKKFLSTPINEWKHVTFQHVSFSWSVHECHRCIC